MNELFSESNKFDVFMCYNKEDKAEVRQIADELLERGLKPWLDEREIRPGQPWQPVLEEQIQFINSAAVFVGSNGLGPWQNMEIRAFINEFVERECPVIPVILPSAKETPILPIFLKTLHYVDFQDVDSNPLDNLIWGITGNKPGKRNDLSNSNNRDIVEEGTLLPNKKKQLIEVRLPDNFEEWTEERQAKVLNALSSLLEISEVKLTKTVAGSVRLFIEVGPEDADKIYFANKRGLLNALEIEDARLYTSIAIPPSEEQMQQLGILLGRVKEFWIEGVFKKSLHNELLISLGKSSMADAVEPPCRNHLALPMQRQNVSLEDYEIGSIFDATGLLLILGEPGSGKTTTLLELAAELIERALKDSKERVPVVLNLSSWEKKQSISDWIILELSRNYRIPHNIGRVWLESDYILPLLDGLDEVESTLQSSCVSSINEFIDETQPSGLVVCCRLTEYRWLTEPLKLNGAICLEPLTPDEVDTYLEAAGSRLEALRETVKKDTELQELTKTPLMLSIMCLSYDGVDVSELESSDAETVADRRDKIFNLYVEKMFRRKGDTIDQRSRDSIVKSLSWLARGMKKHSSSIFTLEGLQPSWLENRSQRVIYEITLAALVGVIFGLIFGQSVANQLVESESSMPFSLGIGFAATAGIFLCYRLPFPESSIYCVLLGVLLTPFLGLGVVELWLTCISFLILIGLTNGLGVGRMSEIRMVESVSLQLNKFARAAFTGVKLGLIIGLGVWSLFAVLSLIAGIEEFTVSGFGSLTDVLLYQFLPISLGVFALFGTLGLVIGGITGAIKSLSNRIVKEKTRPNQGILLSSKSAVIGSIHFGIVFGILFAIFILLIPKATGLYWAENEVSELFRLLFLVMIFFGLVGGLYRGGASIIKHIILRLILYLSGSVPLRLVKVFDRCSYLLLLKKVGGGYIFVHRLLLEYLANLETSQPASKK